MTSFFVYMNEFTKKKIELLAPAGNFNCFLAALSAGADAVYLGLRKFGARANADNFSEEELIEAIKIAHIYGKRVYLTVNTLFKENEIYELYPFLKEVYKHGLDGVIVQDIGVVSVIKDLFPDMEIHASTQMAITDVEGVEFARSLGVCRVVPARELSLKEIKRIHDETGMELECFIHGALCYSYSGKCLFSSCLGERSGNRGSCAGPCRLSYDNEYLLSMKDLCTLRIIPELIDAGIYSFKIEGRMKNEDYVYGVTSIYRKYIDEYLNNGTFNVKEEDEEQLLSLYTREGNSTGYYKMKNGRQMITLKSPAYCSEKRDNGQKICLERVKLSAVANISLNEKPYFNITISDDDSIFNGLSVEVSGNEKIARAQNAPAILEQVNKQLCKMGGSLFEVKNIVTDLDDNVFVSNGELNNLRREAINALMDKISAKFSRGLSGKYNEVYIANKLAGTVTTESNNAYKIKANVLFDYQLDVISHYDYVTDVILNYALVNNIINNRSNNKYIDRLINSKKGIFIRLPYILRTEDKSISAKDIIIFIHKANNYFKEKFGISVRGYYVSSYEEVRIFQQEKKDYELIADTHLYAYNHISRGVLREAGVDNTTVPFELSKKEINDRGIVGEEVVIYGRIPMLISSQCLFKTNNQCKFNYAGNVTYITDRKREKLFSYSDCQTCTSVVYNSVPFSITDELDFIKKISPVALRFDFTCESADEIEMILAKFSSVIKSEYEDRIKVTDRYTKGHLKKGVL